LRGGEVNGSGKSGISIDPTGLADFVAHVGTVVNLSVESPSGSIGLSTVQYDAKPVHVTGNRFELTIVEGMRALSIAVVHRGAEIAELVDSEGKVLRQFVSDVVQFVIRDI
jgi:DNA-directed RNA polymerase subunit K/omega